MNRFSRKLSIVISILVALFFGSAFGNSLYASGVENAPEQVQLNSPYWANEIIKRAVHNKAQNRLTAKDFYKCERYEKLNMGWMNLTSKEKQMLLLRYFKFLFENTDSTDISGKPVDFILSKETLEDDYYRKSSNTKRAVVRGINREWVYSLLHEQGLRSVITEFFNDYCIYDNQMTFLTQSFISPLSSSISQSFYNFNLADTVRIDGVLCYKIDFKPTNDQFLAFQGSVYIAGDSSYAVAKSEYYISNHTNLNFIDAISFKEDYHLTHGLWAIDRNEVSIELSLFKLFARRINTYRSYSFDPIPSQIFETSEPVTYKKDAWNKPDEYWQAHRHFPYSNQEEKARAKLSSYVSGNSSGVTGIFLNMLFKNYLPMGKFDIGPVFSFVSSNDIEGTRLRFGGTTNASLNPHLFLEGYGAYGFRDDRWKYSAKAVYSFPKRDSHPYEFPANSISLLHHYDLCFPGQELVNIDKDNVFLSWRRSPLDRMLFERKTELQYKREYYSGISFSFWGNHREWQPVGAIDFEKKDPEGNITPISSLNTTEVGARFRWAIGERFYQNRDSRFILSRFSSVFTFSHSIGIKNLLGGQYNSQLTEMSLQHTRSLGAFGYVDMMFKAGKQWSRVPYPLLIIPQANQSYVDVPETYNLMNVLEFVCDKYSSVALDYHMNGLLFNWMPVNRYLKLREVFTFKALQGYLSEWNNPALSTTTPWVFPRNFKSYALGATPYTEAGVGIENIFSLIRLDYVWRLTYRDHPNIDKSGIRIGLKVQF